MAGLLNTFVAPDLYNLTLPVVPPATLSLAAFDFAESVFFSKVGSSTQKVVGFNRNNMPYIRGAGVFVNIGDGLVAINQFFGGDGTSGIKGVILRIEGFAYSAIVGEISNTAGTDAITGTGFSRLIPGALISWFDNNAVLRNGIVVTIADDSNATLSVPTGSTGMYMADTTVKTWREQLNSLGSRMIPMVELNQMFRCDFPVGDVSLIPATADLITCHASLVGNVDFSTISVDPSYATKRLIFHAAAEIEHTFEVSGVI